MIIEKYIYKTVSNSYKLSIRVKNKFLIKTYKTLEEAQESKQHFLLNTKSYRNFFDKKVGTKRYYFYTRDLYKIKFLKEHLNLKNPELFDLSFIDAKFKIHNNKLIQNILNSR